MNIISSKDLSLKDAKVSHKLYQSFTEDLSLNERKLVTITLRALGKVYGSRKVKYLADLDLQRLSLARGSGSGVVDFISLAAEEVKLLSM